MSTNSDFKNAALDSLTGKWAGACVATLVYFLLAGVVNDGFSFFMTPEMSIGASVIWIFLCVPLSWGFTVMFLDLVRGSEASVGKMFDGYKQWGRVFFTYILMYIYIILWSMLLIIPGIIKEFSYAMTPYILKDNPELSYNAAIEESMRMMKGNKARLFWLYLSFIGWFILSILTFGIGLILLLPYVETSVAHFYEDLKAKNAA